MVEKEERSAYNYSCGTFRTSEMDLQNFVSQFSEDLEVKLLHLLATLIKF